MSNNINLTAGMRSNLSSLQNLNKALQTTQSRLSTGKKVNSALDNPATFYQASALNQRVSALDRLLDAMGQGIQTISAANTGIETGLQMIEQLKNVITQAKENVEVTTETTPAVAEVGHMEYDVLHDGKAYTKKTLEIFGENALTASAADQFYTPNTDPNDAIIGQHQWYIPAIGEWMDLFGIDCEQLPPNTYYYMDYDSDTPIEITQDVYEAYIKYLDECEAENIEPELTGSYWYDEHYVDESLIDISNPNNTITKVNSTLQTLSDAGIAECIDYRGEMYWSSSYKNGTPLSFITDCTIAHDQGYSSVRLSLSLENQFTADSGPNVGDIIYSDLSFSDADNYNNDKTAIGVVYWTTEDHTSVKIINLKDLHFDPFSASPGKFDPDDPYKSYNDFYEVYCEWYTNSDTDAYSRYIEDQVPNFQNPGTWDKAIENRNSGTWVVDTEGQEEQTIATYDFGNYKNQFANIMQQYDGIIGDCAYQGVNLLNGRDLKLQFKENNGQEFVIKALNADSAGFELTADWSNLEDLDAVTAKLDIMAAQLQAYAQELSNAANIIQIRQNFNDAMRDILQVGADNLVLADMNEESANYLALQTRQQLAINALALAAQSDQSVLKLFN